MSDDLLNIDLGYKVSFEVFIHPLVPLQILDLYNRKYGAKRSTEEEEPRIAGSLMGTIYTNKVHITNCFIVQIDEDPEDQDIFMVDFQEHQFQYQQHNQIFPNEVLIGAFVTGRCNLDIGVAYLSQEYSRKENYFFTTTVMTQPIILKIDPSYQSGKIDMKAFRLNQSLKDYASVASFNTLPVKLSFLDEQYQQVIPFLPREDGVDVNIFQSISQESNQEVIKYTNKNILDLLEYVKRVTKGETEGNDELGRQLLMYLNKVQIHQSDSFRDEFKYQIQEAQFIQYLSNLVLAQTLIGEKLAKI